MKNFRGHLQGGLMGGDFLDSDSEYDDSDVEAVYLPGELEAVPDDEDDDIGEDLEEPEDIVVVRNEEMQQMIHLVGGPIDLQNIVNNVVDNGIPLNGDENEGSDANRSGDDQNNIIEELEARRNLGEEENSSRVPRGSGDNSSREGGLALDGNTPAAAATAGVENLSEAQRGAAQLVHVYNIIETATDRDGAVETHQAQLYTRVLADEQPGSCSVEYLIGSSRTGTLQKLSDDVAAGRNKKVSDTETTTGVTESKNNNATTASDGAEAYPDLPDYNSDDGDDDDEISPKKGNKYNLKPNDDDATPKSAENRNILNVNYSGLKPDHTPKSGRPDYSATADSPDYRPTADSPDYRPTTDSPDYRPTAESPDYRPTADSPDYRPTAARSDYRPAVTATATDTLDDLPDYDSQSQDAMELLRQKTLAQGSVKRKPLDDDEAFETGEEGNKRKIAKGDSCNNTTTDDEDDDDIEEEKEDDYCNPMVSDAEECDQDNALRGDRIGSTTYSERHVLKLLMKWIQEMPKYTELIKAENDEDEMYDTALEKSFGDEMSLLWDMSAETDVMTYLVEKDIFTLVRDTLDRSGCTRLTEVSLGILANLLSQRSIVEDFAVHDAKLKLVSRVVAQVSNVANVCVLTQVFAVLRRIVWFIKNVQPVEDWMTLLLSQEFLNCANFMMISSTNLLLLGDVIITLFTLMETLSPELEEGEKDKPEKEDEINTEVKNKSINPEAQTEYGNDKNEYCENFQPFCETNFVQSLCEGLNELMKNPKPNPAGTTNTGEKTGEMEDGFEVDIPIPAGHVQTAILNGLASLSYLQKTANGRDNLRENKDSIIKIILNFYRKFTLCTESISGSDSLEYFALALNLLGFCHSELTAVLSEAILLPISTASKLMAKEERDKEVDEVIRLQVKNGEEFDSVTYLALVIHEYLAALADKFGEDSVYKVRKHEKFTRFFKVVDEMVSKVSQAQAELVVEDSDKNKVEKQEDIKTSRGPSTDDIVA